MTGVFKTKARLALWKIINIALMSVAFYGAWKLYYNHVITAEFQWKGNMVMVLVFVFLYLVFARIYEAFAVEFQRRLSIMFSQALSLVFADAACYIVIFILAEKFINVLPLLALLCLQLALALCWVLAVYKWYFSAVPPKAALIVQDGSTENWRLHRELASDKNYHVFAVMELGDWYRAELSPLTKAEVVFVCCRRSDQRDAFIKHCAESKIQVLFIPAVEDMLLNAAKHVHMFHMPIMSVELSGPDLGYRTIKRIVDIVVSVSALLILWPVMLVVALLIKLGDGGPCIYKQRRLTKDGKIFELYKFRSMRVDAEADGVARLSTGDNDDRITPVGRFIRRCRLDELPQLLNILLGSMSIVGPRPERPEIAEQYEKDLPEFRLRLQAKAGLTGYAQVYGTYSTTPYDKLQLDLMYISRPSIIEDIRIMFMTLKILFMKESTEGFTEDAAAAVSSGGDRV